MKKTTFLKMLMLAIVLIVGNQIASAATVTYTISDLNTLTTTGTAPAGSSATMVETYKTSQIITNTNSQTLTLSGYSGYKITSITLSMKSNKAAGAGSLKYIIDDGAASTIIANANFDDPTWNGAWSYSSFVDITRTVDITCGTNSTVFKIAATANALVCESYTLTYESTGTSSYTITPLSNNVSFGTVSLTGSVITATPATGYAYASPAYTVMSGTATVVQNGNNFTVTPSSNCTVQINFAVAAPVFTITPLSNNVSFGTVSLTDNVITATPAIGYTYATPAFTVTSGTATVVQNGNNFTVTPSSNCTVQINFAVAAPVFTITPLSNNVSFGTVSLTDNVITATPATGYTYATPAYTVTSGTAIVLQNGNNFTVNPTSNCTVQINFAVATQVSTTVTYTISDLNTLTTTGTAPKGSSATMVETYKTSQIITNTNSQTLTLSGYSGYKITSITLSMRSNKTSGAGSLKYIIDDGAANTIIANANFDDPTWYGAWSYSSFVDITRAVDITCGTSSTVFKIAATANALMCESYTLTYESTSPNKIRDVNANDRDVLVYRNENNQIVVSSKGEINGKGLITVYNAAGQKVASKSLTSTNTVLTDLHRAGAYLVQVSNGGKSSISKLLIK